MINVSSNNFDQEFAAMTKYPQITWPSSYNDLTRIDELLQCRICYNYLETTVMTSCSHNYCSICIRKYLHYKSQCPICFENTYEKDLHANRIVDEFMQRYLLLRDKLFAVIKGAELTNPGTGEKNSSVTGFVPKNTSYNGVVTPQKLEMVTKSTGSTIGTHSRASSRLARTPSVTNSPNYYPTSPFVDAKTPQRPDRLKFNNSTKYCPNSPACTSATPIKLERIDDNYSPTYAPASPSNFTIPESENSESNSNAMRSPDSLDRCTYVTTPHKLENSIHPATTNYHPTSPSKSSPRKSASLNQWPEPSPSTSKNVRLPFRFTPKSATKDGQNALKRVPCPVCQVDIPAVNINKHLDDCLQRKETTSNSRQVKRSREPMPKYVFNLMKDAGLRKLLKQYNLSTMGNRKVLEKRLQRFSVLYNAECDKLEPKSVSEIAKICEEEELAEKHAPKPSISDSVLNLDRRTDPNLIEKAQKEYLQKHKNDFDQLISTINVREKKSGNVVKSLFGANSDDPTASTSGSQKSLFGNVPNYENDELGLVSPDLGQFVPPDSDSNASCALLRYSTEDTMRFLAIELSSDSIESRVKAEPLSPIESKPHVASPMKYGTIPGKSRCTSPKQSGSSTVSSSVLSSRMAVTKKQDPSDVDIFDASTEDNWSDSQANVETPIRRKKLMMKRSKVKSINDGSSDSETEFEACSGKAMKKSPNDRLETDEDTMPYIPFDCTNADESNLQKDTVSEVHLKKSSPERTIDAAETALASSHPMDQGKENDTSSVDAKKNPRRLNRKRSAASSDNPSKVEPVVAKNKRGRKVLENSEENRNNEDRTSASNRLNSVTKDCQSTTANNYTNSVRTLRKRPNR